MIDKTAIVIINYKTAWHLKKCLESVFKNSTNFHIILIQNAPDYSSIKVAENFKTRFEKQITVINHEKNLGFVGGINSAFSEAIKYERICLLNSDCVVSENWLKILNDTMNSNPQIVQLSPDTNTLHLYRQGKITTLIKSILPSSFDSIFPKLKSEAKIKGFKEYSNFYEFPGGYCNLIKTEAIIQRGFFADPNIIHGYWDEFDLTSYLRTKGLVGWTDEAYVYHYHNVSLNKLVKKNKSNNLKLDLIKLNGFYVMYKWEKYIKKEIEKMSLQKIMDRQDSYVFRTALLYLGTIEAKPEFRDYISTIPAREVGEKFLN